MEFNYTRRKKKERERINPGCQGVHGGRNCLGHQTSIRMVLLEKGHCWEWVRTRKLARIDLAGKGRAKGFGRRRTKYRNCFSRSNKH